MFVDCETPAAENQSENLVPGRRNFNDPESEKENKLREWWKLVKEQSRRRIANRELANNILSRGDTPWLFEVPPEKYAKLIKAAGSATYYEKNSSKRRSMDETVEDLANDSFFAEFMTKQEDESDYFISKESSLDSTLSEEQEAQCQDADASVMNATDPYGGIFDSIAECEADVSCSSDRIEIRENTSPAVLQEVQTNHDSLREVLAEVDQLENMWIDGADGISVSTTYIDDSISEMGTEENVQEAVQAAESIVGADAASMRTPPQNHEMAPLLYYRPAVYRLVDYRAKHVDQPLLIAPATVHQYLIFLSNDPLISRFMRYDYCNRVSDKYLLAVVCIFFVRSGLPEYTQDAFFKFLYLANETHEDDEESRDSIIASVLVEGQDAYIECIKFRSERLGYWKLLKYETFVLRETLEQLFNVDPDNPIWSRERAKIHAGATRRYIYEPVAQVVKGCYDTPMYCECCVQKLPPAALPTMLRSAAKRRRLPFKKRHIPYARTPAANAEY